jgi:hypothetical protein
MRTLLFTIFYCSLFGFVSAQISIDQSNMPNGGDVFPYRLLAALPSGADPIVTGEGIVWDYSGLNAGLAQADTFNTVGSTPFAYQFFFNNPLIYPSYNANYAKKDIDVDFGIVTLENTYVFYKNNGQGLRNVGYGAEVNGIPTPVQNDPIDYIYEFPLEYEDSFESSSASEVDIPFVGYFQRTLQRSTEVEGYGTLVLPSGEFEVLKVKVILNASDSLYIVDFGTGFRIDQPEETIYQWIAEEHVQPVLQISQQLGFGYTIQYYEELSTGLEETVTRSLKIFPNPTSDRLYFNPNHEEAVSYDLYDLQNVLVTSGRLPQNSEIVEVDLKGLSAGVYLLLLNDKDGQVILAEKVLKN